MILQALIKYAEREGIGDADFETVGLRWLVSISRSGTMSGPPVDLSTDGQAGRKQVKRVTRPFTRADDVGHGKAHFLVDNLERALGMFDEEAPEMRATQHIYFKALLREAAEDIPSEAKATRAVLQFLEDKGQLSELYRQLREAKAKTSDNVAFQVDGRDLLASEALQAFWRQRRRRELATVSRTRRICVATGIIADTLDTTEKVRASIPGGLARTNLISFDKEAFRSFNLDQAQNAAISPEAELKIRSALDDLIEKGCRTGNVVYVHWTKEKVVHDPLDLLENADEAAIQALLQAPRTGVTQTGLDKNAYYAMGLSGNGGRIVVRDWLTSTVGEVAEHVAAWFQNLMIVVPDGSQCKCGFKLKQVLGAMENFKLEKPSSVLPEGAPEKIIRSALTGCPLPGTILSALLRRETIDRASKDEDTGKRVPFMAARFALIKACLIRSSTERKENRNVTSKLDLDSKDVAYLCGQLFAIIGRTQLLALGQVGASIAERTYGGVATRPATTMGPLFTKLPAYLKKANTRFPGAGTNKQKEIEILSLRIESLGGIPAVLDLEQQGRFALGYYCQLAEYRARREEAEIEEAAAKISDDNI
ncbi:MAG: type I-C CRISPR-associated protein Cas8c/Csd1 [Kiritimatiellae bacterium]|nr:type I-C CRISPR-associated protein Cas8c/Csd1 [Kiritimatiellia bacterium]